MKNLYSIENDVSYKKFSNHKMESKRLVVYWKHWLYFFGEGMFLWLVL